MKETVDKATDGEEEGKEGKGCSSAGSKNGVT